MINIDKQKINENINDAYNNQTEKVKELLESAKKNLADQKECLYDYTANKEKVKQLYKVNKVITKKKQAENQAENRINEKFNKMNERLDVNSKNLDFIFKTVSENNENLKNELTSSIEKNVKKHQKNTENKIIKCQTKLEETLLNANSSIEHNVLENQKESEKRITYKQNILEQKMEQLQQINEQKLMEIKNEIIKSYQNENKHAINTLLEERNAYLREIQEKDREIRQLNYKIYEYEEKLEKEIARREKFSIFAPFFRKQEVQEEEPIYTSQILNYVYQ